MYQACRWIVPLDVTCCKPPVWCGPSTDRGQGVAYSAENPPRHLGTYTHTHTHNENRKQEQSKKSIERKLLRSRRAALDVFRSVDRGGNVQRWTADSPATSPVPLPHQPTNMVIHRGVCVLFA